VVFRYAHDEIEGIKLILSGHGGTEGIIQNVEFLGFEDTMSDTKCMIQVKPGAERASEGSLQGSIVKGIKVPDGMDPFHFDFSEAVDMGIKGLYVLDSDSSMNPSSSSTFTGASTVIANTADMRARVDLSKCTTYSDYAFLYCRGQSAPRA
jgi:hypothetical protein